MVARPAEEKRVIFPFMIDFFDDPGLAADAYFAPSIQRWTWASRMGSGKVPSPSTTSWNFA